MNTPIKIVLDLAIDEVEFDYKSIKKLITELFSGQQINLQVEDFEDVEFEEDEEDYLIEISTMNYGDGYDGNYHEISLKIDNNRIEKDLNLAISGQGDISESKFKSDIPEMGAKVTPCICGT